MFSQDLIEELNRAFNHNLLIYARSGHDGYLTVRFLDKSITTTHIENLQKYIEATYRYRTHRTYDAGLVIYNIQMKQYV